MAGYGHIDKIKQLAAMDELPVMDEAAFMAFRLDKENPLEIEEDFAYVVIPTTFNVDAAFGLDVCQVTNEDSIELYAEWRVGKVDSLALYVTYRNNSTVDGDFYFRVALDERQKRLVYARLEDQCCTLYGKPIVEIACEVNQNRMPMTKEKFWKIIDSARAKAPIWEAAPLRESLYQQLLKLSPDELVGFDCAWQEYRRIAKTPQLMTAACIINSGTSDDRFDYFKNWLILQGQYAFRQALKDPDTLAALKIPFDDTEWEDCGYLTSLAFVGSALPAYFAKEGITKELYCKYPSLLQAPGALDAEIMRVLLYPNREQEQVFDRYLLGLELQQYIDTSGLDSYDKVYQNHISHRWEWNCLRESIREEAPNSRKQLIVSSHANVLPKLWRKRMAWENEQYERSHHRGEER